MYLQTWPNIFLQANAPGLGICMQIISLPSLPEFYLGSIPINLWDYDKDSRDFGGDTNGQEISRRGSGS
jgi:hypothetical protein